MIQVQDTHRAKGLLFYHRNTQDLGWSESSPHRSSRENPVFVRLSETKLVKVAGSNEMRPSSYQLVSSLAIVFQHPV